MGLRRDLNPPQAVSAGRSMIESFMVPASTAAYTDQAILRRPQTYDGHQLYLYSSRPHLLVGPIYDSNDRIYLFLQDPAIMPNLIVSTPLTSSLSARAFMPTESPARCPKSTRFPRIFSAFSFAASPGSM
jgi:hypothetical protein